LLQGVPPAAVPSRPKMRFCKGTQSTRDSQGWLGVMASSISRRALLFVSRRALLFV
jgi:hypothetical protein